MKRRLYAIYCLTERVKTWFSARFTLLGKAILLTTLVAFFFGLSVQRTMLYQVFAVGFSLLLISFVCTLRSSVRVRVKRHLPQTCVAGKAISYRISIENEGEKKISGQYLRESMPLYLPSWQEFSTSREEGEEKRNIFDRKMGYYRWLWLLSLGRYIKVENHALPEIEQGQIKDVNMTFLPLRRGNIHLQGHVLGNLDPFGLCRYEKSQEQRDNILVLPKLYPVSQLFFTGSRKYHQGGITAAQDRGESNEFLTLREYSYGDPVKHIDWKATARTGRAIVKQYRDEYYSRYGLVLDSFTLKKFSQEFEEAVSLAASIMMSQDSVNSVLDLLFVERECVTCSMGKGLAGRQRMLEILASVETCRNRDYAELAALVRSHVALLSGIVLIFIDMDEERIKLLNYLLANNVPTKAIFITDDIEAATAKINRFSCQIPIRLVETEKVEQQVAQL